MAIFPVWSISKIVTASFRNLIAPPPGGFLLASILSLLLSAGSGRAACTACTGFQPGVTWGTVTVNALTEASGLAASARNLGVLWTHNDGNREKIYALGTNGSLLATFNLKKNVADVEDIAVGPGPLNGVFYLYVGDIGGNKGTNIVRPDVKLIRLPEPSVELAWAGNPESADFDDVEDFTLVYPDGSYDAETLMVDPVSGDVLVVTKQTGTARVYRVNLNGATNNATLNLEFVRAVSFSQASGGDISADGTQIVLRREDLARLWARCDNESISTALGRTGDNISVIGPPTELNGEAIAFLREGIGYMTISEGLNPSLYLFQSSCPASPRFTLPLSGQSVFAGGTATFNAIAVGYPAPAYRWFFNGQLLAGQNNASLVLSNLTFAHAGSYTITASNSSGVATSLASLMVRAKPDLRITEVLSSTAAGAAVPTSDWWELTSFETQPVNLSGWQFNDNAGGLTDPFVIGSDVILGPGESMVFAEGLSLAAFRAWWGLTNLPAGLQVVNYSGNGLSLGAAGDGLRLWANQPLDLNDTVASVDFGAATAGVTFNYDPVTAQFGGVSQLGVNGVVRAEQSNDLGSPGRILAPVVGPALSARLSGGTIRLGFQGAVGRRYTLQFRDDFTTATWTPAGDTLLATNNAPLYFEKTRTAEQRFYRVVAQ